ncbi:hypothetical protein KKR91_13115 [Arthrobacter jiangjiafuii]|uniref:Uncharacterized protein n=2 Tax=Arthrobacter jiangjiafuii TaxID=2817475 RepID=A0A975R2R9_9MICC|nr:hypothetical protein [Arthrobacter jiangjiafuii]QWC11826.1 hypothetical protein KKR91_13115 [Arthrobacter jiangjiafuii]
MILAVTVGLWLLWVAPYMLRRPASALPAVLPPPSSTAIRSSISADGLSQQGNIMNNTASARPGTSAATTSPASENARPQATQPAFRIRYGRAALALAGALAVVTVIAGLPLALFGAASWWLPAGAAVLTAAVVASLRTLAVRDRRSRVNAAFRAAMASGSARRAAEPEAAPAEAPVVQERPQRETVLFDAESTGTAKVDDAGETSVSTAPGSPDRPLTAAELRTAALAVAAQAAPQAPAGPPKTSTTPWEPVEVPKPTYVEAAVAPRAAPEPIVLPQTPKPAARTSIRAGAEAAAADNAAGAEAALNTGKINLDDVLQRRRA